MSDSDRQPRTDPPHIDTQSLTDKETDMYETVATLEYAGLRPSRAVIVAATHLDPAEVDATLAEMTAEGLLTAAAPDDRSAAPRDTVYRPAHRDWSTMPDEAAAHPFF
jgi:hypothetical protein